MVKQFNIANNILTPVKNSETAIEVYIDPTDSEKKILEEKYNIRCTYNIQRS